MFYSCVMRIVLMAAGIRVGGKLQYGMYMMWMLGTFKHDSKAQGGALKGRVKREGRERGGDTGKHKG